MAMFGGLRETDQQRARARELERLFGGTPPIAPETQAAVSQYAGMPMQQAPQGGGWAGKLGDLGTSLMAAQAAWDGDLGTSAGLSQSIGAADRAQQASLAKRLAEREDWLFQEQWKRANPAAVNNDTRNDYEYIRSILGDEAATNFLRNKTDPTVSIPLPGGQTYVGPKSGLGASQAPAAPVGRLTPINPGGGVGNGAGGFRTDIPSGNPLQPWPRR